jgi:hypothetical protein
MLLLFVAACTSPPAAVNDVTQQQQADIGPCAENASLFGINVAELPVDLTLDTQLPVTQGFQGFIFVRVGLRTSGSLPAVAKVYLHLTIDGLLDQTYGPVPSNTRGATKGGMETTEVPFFFNDTPLADLVGRSAHLKAWTTATGCRLSAETDVKLSAGGYMGADAGIWGEVSP